MTHEQYYEEEVFEEEYYEQEDDRCTYEQRWWDYSFYEDTRFL